MFLFLVLRQLQLHPKLHLISPNHWGVPYTSHPLRCFRHLFKQFLGWLHLSQERRSSVRESEVAPSSSLAFFCGAKRTHENANTRVCDVFDATPKSCQELNVSRLKKVRSQNAFISCFPGSREEREEGGQKRGLSTFGARWFDGILLIINACVRTLIRVQQQQQQQ